MRVGIVISNYRRYGGLERMSGEWARGLAARGHGVTVFAQTFEPGEGDEAIEFIPVGGAQSPIALRAATFPPAATRTVRRNPRDLIVSFGYGVLDPCVVRLPGAHRPWWEIASRIAPPTSWEGLRRRMNPHHRIVLALERRLLGAGMPLAVLAAAEGAANDIKRLYPRVAPVVEIVPDGVALDSFTFDEEARNALRASWGVGERAVVLTVATEVRRKGIENLFSALVGIERDDVLLVVAGTASRDEVARAASELGVAARVRVAGFVADIAAAYSAADLLVFPTLYDHWGLPVVESLACGTPVAASAHAGAAQAIDDGRTGVLIRDPADPSDIAGAITRGLKLEASREDCRAAAEPFGWPRVVDLVEKRLLAILERTR